MNFPNFWNLFLHIFSHDDNCMQNDDEHTDDELHNIQIH